jgi:type I restriction enzyme R subunit
MRDVKSEGYYEQMKGRGVRTIPDSDLQMVTPDARTKTRFVLIDAVGVTETKKNASQPLERKKTIAFDKLLDQVAQGRRDEDAVSSLAGRLAALDRKLDNEDRARIADATGGKKPRDLANDLLEAVDPDRQQQAIESEVGGEATPEQESAVIGRLLDTACAPFDDPETRELLKTIKHKNDLVIDEVTTDEVREAEFDKGQAEQRIRSFREFIEANRDELTALQILYNQPAGRRRLSYAAIKELAQAMTDKPYYLTTADVWQAYKRLNAAKVKGAPVDNQLTEIVSLVRFALGYDEVLEPYSAKVEQRFNLWIGREKKAGREYTAEQMDWLKTIAGYIAANAEIRPRDFIEIPSLSDKGGIVRAQNVFGRERFSEMLDELQGALVA